MPPRKVPPNEDLQRLYDKGMSGREIANVLNLNINTVISALSRLGISSRTTSETRTLQRKRGIKSRAGRYWLGKKQPPEMVEKRVSKIRGERHYMWKGGEHRRPYRGVINKEKCATCGSTKNLGIHHKDFDHYNNDPANLEILCNPCHMSLHKTEYWQAKQEGREPRRSNGPIGWEGG